MTDVESLVQPAPPQLQPRMRPRARLGLGMAIGAATYAVGCVLGAVGALFTPESAVTQDATNYPVLTIFGHNLGVLLLFGAGLISAGLITVAVMGFNGMLLGWVIATELSAGHSDALMTGILPHLPFELMAYIVGAGATLRLSVEVAGWVIKRGPNRPTAEWAPWLRAQALAAVLLFVGAVVESNFSHV
jgi:uncharacterized membrane protein SpoIIM required for sporulation